jgi:hypothetical protein
MTEPIPPRPFDDREALTWLRSQPDGRVTTSAAELGRRWGWNRMRTSRRLKTWEVAGLIRRNAEAIIVTTSVTPAVTDDMPVVTERVDVTGVSGPKAIRRSATSVRLAALIVALALACVSAAFSVDGLTQSLPVPSGPSSSWEPCWRPAGGGGLSNGAFGTRRRLPCVSSSSR